MKEDMSGNAQASQLASRARLRAFIVFAITVGGILVCSLLAIPFLPALTWALALAIIFMPAHRWLEGKVRNPHVAAAISVLWIGLLVVIPTTLIGGRLVSESAKGAATVKERLASGEWRRTLESHDALAQLTTWIEGLDLPDAITSVTAWVAATSASFVRGGVLQVITALMTFYLLFYFLRDRAVVLNWLRQISPLSEEEMGRLFRRVVETVQATLYGTVTVAIAQGTLGGLIFWLLGLPTPLLWGVVMGLLAIVPVLGAFVVWVPAAIFLLLDGSWVKALILILWGVVVVGGIDNLLHPILVGNRLKVHTVPSFISIVGGLVLFGASGVILGPLAVSLTIFFLEIWRVPMRNNAELS